MIPLFVPQPYIAAIQDSWEGLEPVVAYLPVRPYPTRPPAKFTPDLQRTETVVDRLDKADWRITPPNNRSMDLVEYEREFPPFRVGTELWIPEPVAICQAIAGSYTHIALFDNGRWIARLPKAPSANGLKSQFNAPHGEHRFEVRVVDFEIERLSVSTAKAGTSPLPWLGLWKMQEAVDPWVWAVTCITSRAIGGVVP